MTLLTLHRLPYECASLRSFSGRAIPETWSSHRANVGCMRLPTTFVVSGRGAAVKPLPAQSYREQRIPSVDVPATELGWPSNIEERYSMGKYIGAGSYGLVYEGINCQGTTYAVKMMAKERRNASRERTLSHLRKEASLLERFEGCRSIVQLVDKFETEDCAFFVMELCDGLDLQEVVLTKDLSEAQVARIIHDCLAILRTCHARGVVHGDVKPANFIVTDYASLVHPTHVRSLDTPLLKAIDFGCSQAVQHGKKLTRRTGTPVYMAPEVYLKDYSFEADVWSLGVMAYQLFTGAFPFWDTVEDCLKCSLEEVRFSVLEADVSFERGTGLAHISDEAKDFLKQLLVRDPEERVTVDAALKHPWLQRHLDVPANGCCVAEIFQGNILPFKMRSSAVSGLDQTVPVYSLSFSENGELEVDGTISVAPLDVWTAMHSTARYGL